MTARIFWFLPTAGDGRSIVGASHASSHRVEPAGFRRPSLRYLTEVAQAADRLDYEGVLTPTGTWCEDAWLTTAALLQATRRLKFLVAFRPGLTPPTLAAQQAATLQRFSEGRVLFNIVTGGDDAEQRRFGDWVDHDRRYARTDEFLDLVHRIWTEESVDHDGEFYRVEDARVSEAPDPLPEFWFGGSSDPALAVAAKRVQTTSWGEPLAAGGASNPALAVAAKRVQTYLTWGEPPAAAKAKIERVRALADAEGRKLTYGIRLHTISRDTSEEAWGVAQRLLDELPDDAVDKAHQLHAASQSEGQRRMAALHGGSKDSLEIYPNLWAGVGLIRG
uniref:LLM class flavin-dependent oxidoreductase n=1 Tax=Rhodococcoides corynebacterioides TaxID=53972 RepID=UPI000830B0C1